MLFNKKLFCDSSVKNNMEYILNELRKAENVVIWGTGAAGTMIKHSLDRLHIDVMCFVDTREELRNQMFYGKPIKGVSEIPGGGCIVIIAANVRYGLHKQLQKLGHDNYFYIDPMWLYFYDEFAWNGAKNKIEQNYDKIEQLYGWLNDDHSRKVLSNILLHRMVHNLELVWEVYDEHQYFGNHIIQKASGGFVDCGAFQGDTLDYFMNQVGNAAYKYWAFEADEYNYNVLKRKCYDSNWKDVEIHKLAVWDKKDTLFFENNDVMGNVAGKIAEENAGQGIVVNADSLDNIIMNEKVDFIKMDIEGAELNALKGAEKLIRSYKPILAISAYHKLEHLWEVPQLIKKIDCNYGIYFGHHMWNMADTVCYGIYNSTSRV